MNKNRKMMGICQSSSLGLEKHRPVSTCRWYLPVVVDSGCLKRRGLGGGLPRVCASMPQIRLFRGPGVLTRFDDIVKKHFKLFA